MGSIFVEERVSNTSNVVQWIPWIQQIKGEKDPEIVLLNDLIGISC
jgi:hypothetical protein